MKVITLNRIFNICEVDAKRNNQKKRYIIYIDYNEIKNFLVESNFINKLMLVFSDESIEPLDTRISLKTIKEAVLKEAINEKDLRDNTYIVEEIIKAKINKKNNSALCNKIYKIKKLFE